MALENLDCIHLEWFLGNALLERAPDYTLNTIDGIWEFFRGIGNELTDVAQRRLTAQEAFGLVQERAWETDKLDDGGTHL